MLAEGRRGSAGARLALAVLDGGVDDAHGPAGGVVVELDDHAAGAGVGVVEGGADVVDGRVGHAAALEDGQPLGRRPLGADGLDAGLELVAVRHPRRVGAVLRVGRPLRVAQPGAQDPEEPVVAPAEEDVAVFRLEGLVRDDRRCCERGGGDGVSLVALDLVCALYVMLL